MNTAISVKGISKQYELGSELIAGQSFREMLLGSITAPFRKFRRLRGDDKSRERFWALRDITFDINPGEVVGIIGRNGAGKSTLLKILSRITTPTEGEIAYRGRLASLLEVGTGFHPELTGRENIYLNGAILGMTRNEISLRLDEIVEFAGIEKFLDTPVKRFSSGMYVRLAFSVAAHLDPDILLVDEVLAVGDIEFQKKCLTRLQSISQGQGKTVLFVSHNLDAIQRICGRGIYLKKGEIAYIGNCLEAVKCYKGQSLKGSEDDLISHSIERWGTGKARISHFNVLDHDDNRAEILVSGKNCSIAFGLEVNGDAMDEPMIGSLSLQDERGTTVLLVSSDMEGVNISPKKKSPTIAALL